MIRALILAILFAVSSALHAQYPSRAILLVVPFTAGSDADLAARNLAQYAPTRQPLKALPDVPTARSLGWPEMEMLAAWSALAGPPQLPREVIARWTDVLAKLSHDPGWLAGNEKLGGIPAVRSPAETERYVREQYQLYERLSDRLGLRQ